MRVRGLGGVNAFEGVLGRAFCDFGAILSARKNQTHRLAWFLVLFWGWLCFTPSPPRRRTYPNRTGAAPTGQTTTCLLTAHRASVLLSYRVWGAVIGDAGCGMRVMGVCGVCALIR
jgi:hypothetical protein